MKKGKVFNRLLAMLLVLVMVSGMLPSMALAADVFDVNIYAGAADITFKNAAGEGVPAEQSSGGGYQVYKLKGVSTGKYTYESTQYGTGVLMLDQNEDIYLRIVDFTFKTGGSSFYIQVTNSTAPELVYTSPTVSGLSAKLLVPALGWGVTYRYDFCPEAGWCAFHGPLWVTQESGVLQGFKQSDYNLSDSGHYMMARETEVTFKVPTGAALGVYALVKFYREPVEFDFHKERTEGVFDIYTATVPSTFGGNLYCSVSGADGITTFTCFEASESMVTINPSQIEGNPETQVEQSFEASLISNGNRAKFIPLQIGEEFAIWTSRAWQAIDTITTNRYVEPDKHYYVISGDAVTVDDIGTVTAVKEGTAIVAMTYDAMNYNGVLYSAVNSESIAVFAFTVGKSSGGITSGLINSTDLHTYYVAIEVTMDGFSEPIATNDHTEHTFTPTDANGEQISVRVCTIYGYPMPEITHSWTSYTADKDGSFKINLYPGRNVVEIAAGDRVVYHVLNCKASPVSITNDSAPGFAPKKDETVTVRFTILIYPFLSSVQYTTPDMAGRFTLWEAC